MFFSLLFYWDAIDITFTIIYDFYGKYFSNDCKYICLLDFFFKRRTRHRRTLNFVSMISDRDCPSFMEIFSFSLNNSTIVSDNFLTIIFNMLVR